MHVNLTLVDPAYDVQRNVLLDSDDSVPLAEVMAELTRVLATPADTGGSGDSGTMISLAGARSGAAHGAPARPLYLGGVPLDPTVTVGESGLKEGSLIVCGDAQASRMEEPYGVAEVRVVTGAGAGAVHRLLPGDASIGSDPSCVVRIRDDRVPPVAALITVDVDGEVRVRAADGAADDLARAFPHIDPALALDREPLGTDLVAWPRNAQVGLGELLLELEAVEPADAAVEDSADPGWLDYNRPPRLLPPARQTVFRLPSLPEEPTRLGFPLIVMLAPILMAVIAAYAFHRMTMLMFAVLSPIMLIGNYLQQKKTGKVDHKRKMAIYREQKAAVEADAAQAIVDERSARRHEAPDPALVLLIATGPRVRLWERRPTDPDYLSIRVGVGDLESEVTVTDPQQLDHKRETRPVAYDVPVTIPLRERGVIGFAGPGDLPRRLGTWAIAQIGVLQSPRDTHVYVLTDQDGAHDWEWVRWLPHAQPQHGQDTVVTLGTDAETNARRVAELSAMVAARQAALADKKQGVTFPDVVVVIDGARRLRMLPGVVALLKTGPAVGIFCLCLDSEERLLPEEASAVVVQTSRGLTLRQMHVTVVDDIAPDLVGQPWLQRVSRALAPIRDISGGESDSVLPAACRLTEVMDLEPLSADVIAARWMVSPRSTEAVVGVSLDGPFSIDMRKDGPHGLVAGTTGAGKSELLQSVVASLAVANQPTGMTFVLVDYKGGAAFKDCVDLPHTVGMVTDLDTHLVERALVSLGAELHRREHILADAGAKDIEDFIDLKAKRPELPEMPRLLIVIDEFASMARELPDFVTGLVNIAQRGRSLGIHLILATQRPGGVVSPEIRANTNLRIALRVTDASESSDVIDSPESARISKNNPGRAYVRLGANSLVPFQSGRVGGRRPGAVQTTVAAPWLVAVDTVDLPQPRPARPRQQAAQDDAEITDLTVLVESIREANDRLGIPAQHSPWLPALTTSVQLDDLLAERPRVVTDPDDHRIEPLPFGLEDLPAQQARRTATLDLATFSHLAIMGGPRSGRSQALRTVAASIGLLTSPEDVHLYALDCGNGALLPLADLPHCGAVVQRTQSDRALRLFSRLKAELARRQEVLGAQGFAGLGELRAAVPAAERMPHIVFLIDRWEGFMGGLAEANGGTPYEDVQTLLREGASVGIHLILTGDRSVSSARLSSLLEDKISLRLPDKSDFGLIGLMPRKMPDEIPDGRGFRSESGVELQFALIAEVPSGQAQAARLRAIGADATARYADLPREVRPFRVDVLPGRIGFEEAWELRPEKEPRPLWGLMGVGGDELVAHGLDLAYTNAAIIAGPPRTGRSTALMAVAESLLRGGTQLVVATPRPSPLRDLEGRDGVRAVLTGTELEQETLEPLMDPEPGPVVLLIDDGELLKDVACKDYLRGLLRTGGDQGQAVVLGGDSNEVGTGFSGWQVDMKGRSGLLIQPQGITDGELIGVRIPRGMAGQTAPAGRAWIADGKGGLLAIQVPFGP